MKPQIPLGTTLDNRYRVIKILGQGGFGRVYLAEHINGFGAKCAIKEFAPDVRDADPIKVKELFDRECRNLQKLEHLQIPRFRELLPTKVDGHEYILLVQDFIDGESYHEILSGRAPYSEVEAVDFLRQILPVLTYIHDRNIIHRDIAPDNIICRQREGKTEPVLIDFGIVKVLSNQYTQVHTVIGKKGYAPEEQRTGANLSPSSDLHALAATVIFLLSKQQPETFYDAYRGVYNLSSLSISAEFRGILDRMLMFKPLDRFQSATDILNILARLPASLNSQPASQPNPQIPVPPISPSIYYLFQNADIWRRIKKDFNKPLMYVGGGVIVIFTGIFILGKIIQGIAGIFQPSPSPTVSTAPIPPTSTAPSPSPTSFLDRMKAAKVSNTDVNKVFYQKHPEINGRQLGNSEADRQLAKEWVQIAEDLITTANRSTEKLPVPAN
jgi:serine/threonine protein kinase